MRQRIIEHTLKLVGTTGLRKFTMDAIAAELRMSKRTLYMYFPSKEQLLVTCLATWLDRNRLLTVTAGNLVDELCLLHERVRKADRPHLQRCCRDMHQCCVPLYDFFLGRLFAYADACGEQARKDAEAGYLRRDVSSHTVSAVISDYLLRLLTGNELRVPEQSRSLTPEILVVFARGLCTIKGRAHLDRQLKHQS